MILLVMCGFSAVLWRCGLPGGGRFFFAGKERYTNTERFMYMVH